MRPSAPEISSVVLMSIGRDRFHRGICLHRESMLIDIFEAQSDHWLKQHDDGHGFIWARADRSAYPLIDRCRIHLEIARQLRDAIDANQSREARLPPARSASFSPTHKHGILSHG